MTLWPEEADMTPEEITAMRQKILYDAVMYYRAQGFGWRGIAKKYNMNHANLRRFIKKYEEKT